MTGEFAIAVHAIVYLNHAGETLSSEALAKNVCTNPARIRKVMARLRSASLIAAKEGAEGGYRFVLDPARVTLLDVLTALDLPAVSASWRSGDPNMECLVASGMAEVMDDVYRQLNACCRERLSAITIRQIDQRIFQGRTNSGRD